MVLDPIPQPLPVHFFGSRPQPPTSRHGMALRHSGRFSELHCDWRPYKVLSNYTLISGFVPPNSLCIELSSAGSLGSIARTALRLKAAQNPVDWDINIGIFFLTFMVHGAFKHTHSIPLRLRFLACRVLWGLWDFFLFLSFFFAILLGDVIL